MNIYFIFFEFINFYECSWDIIYRCDTNVLSSTLKSLANYILDQEIEGSSKLLSGLLDLDETTSQNNISYLLTPLAECVYEMEYDDVHKLTDLALWPFKSQNFFTDVSEYVLIYLLK